MSKSTYYLIIGFGIASILFALYGMYRGGEFIDALGGIIIGASLIGTAFFEKNKKDKNQ